MHKGWIMTAAAAAGVSTIHGVFYGFFVQDLAWHHARISTGSQTFQSRFGAMEFAVQGGGPTVIMIHGTGGGFDQGLSMAAPLVAAGYRVIAPSRFGYLQTDFPDDPTWLKQHWPIVSVESLSGHTPETTSWSSVAHFWNAGRII